MKTNGQYLLDTCVCIALIKKVPSVIENIRRVGLGNCKISEITLAELFFGAFKSGKEKHFLDVDVIKGPFEQYSITNSLREYGDIRWQLEHMGKRSTILTYSLVQRHCTKILCLLQVTWTILSVFLVL